MAERGAAACHVARRLGWSEMVGEVFTREKTRAQRGGQAHGAREGLAGMGPGFASHAAAPLVQALTTHHPPGGEGATAREVLRHKTVEQVVMVDIDKVRGCGAVGREGLEGGLRSVWGEE